jgi:hypothetical protein
VSRSTAFRASHLSQPSSTVLFLPYPLRTVRQKIPRCEIEATNSFWLEACPVISGSRGARLQFLTDNEIWQMYQDYAYLLYENSSYLEDREVLESKSKRAKSNLTAAFHNIAIYSSLASSPDISSFLLSNPMLPPLLNTIVFQYVFGVITPYRTLSRPKFFELRNKLKIRVSKTMYYGNWQCKVAFLCFVSFFFFFI